MLIQINDHLDTNAHTNVVHIDAHSDTDAHKDV
jgi:hypothetical protein